MWIAFSCFTPLAFCSQVVNWLEGPGSEQLRAQWGIGDSIRASQALQQKHEEIESQHSVSSFPSASHSVVVCVSLVPGWAECWVLACSRRWYRAPNAYVERLGVWKYPWRLKIDSWIVGLDSHTVPLFALGAQLWIMFTVSGERWPENREPLSVLSVTGTSGCSCFRK